MYYVVDIYSENSLCIDNLHESCVEYIRDDAERDNSLQYIGEKSFLVVGKNLVTGGSQISAYYKDEKERNAMVSGLMHVGKDYMKTYVNLFNWHRTRELEGHMKKRPSIGHVSNGFQQQLAY